ncbi:hypothetical protein EYF80_025438 [Liparis tanakae]|uniref:Uncharacterized protein n=1 Tax=Liparis tanakae TaxID=230148 RepID=A0A4Z2HEK8_9TELE|nr:hypothetical protein EYF80_025438 [Liparis tanakae]
MPGDMILSRARCALGARRTGVWVERLLHVVEAAAQVDEGGVAGDCHLPLVLLLQLKGALQVLSRQHKSQGGKGQLWTKLGIIFSYCYFEILLVDTNKILQKLNVGTSVSYLHHELHISRPAGGSRGQTMSTQSTRTISELTPTCQALLRVLCKSSVTKSF